MRSKVTTPLVYTVNRGAVCVADGYRVTVRVRHGRLIVEDGFGPDRRRREYTRVTAPIVRLLVIGNGGSISLEALCWLRDVGAALVHITRDGRLVATTTPDSADARLRRAQALATTNGRGVEVARFILGEKIAGQRRVLTRLTDDPGITGSFDSAAVRLIDAETIDELRWAERDAALAYWTAWAPVQVRFPAADGRRVPEQWLRFGQRSSPLTGGPRLAINPANAILGYCYRLLEAETTLACLTVGLDPSLGVVHADYRSRDSLALDLMEAVRPDVDAHVLRLLRARTFRAADFHDTRSGVCRLKPPLTTKLGETLPTWRKLIAPVAEQVAQMLIADKPSAWARRLSTPLTRANHAAARDAIRRQPAKRQRPKRTCKRCGGDLPNQGRVYCDSCLPIFQQEQLESGGARASAVEILKSRGKDSTHGGQAAERRGQTIAARKQAAKQWDESYGKLVDLSAFDREILPLIQHISLSRLVRATGLSLRYVSQVRRGEKRPHPRHWAAMVSLADKDQGNYPFEGEGVRRGSNGPV